MMKSLRPRARAVGHLADSGSVGIVGHSHRQTEFLAHQLSQGDGSRPGQVDALLDHAVEVVGVGSADTYAVDLVGSIVGLYQARSLRIEFVDIVIDFAVLTCLD